MLRNHNNNNIAIHSIRGAFTGAHVMGTFQSVLKRKASTTCDSKEQNVPSPSSNKKKRISSEYQQQQNQQHQNNESSSSNWIHTTQFQCHHCREYKSDVELQRHLWFDHLECRVKDCFAVFKNRIDLETHMAQHHLDHLEVKNLAVMMSPKVKDLAHSKLTRIDDPETSEIKIINQESSNIESNDVESTDQEPSGPECSDSESNDPVSSDPETSDTEIYDFENNYPDRSNAVQNNPQSKYSLPKNLIENQKKPENPLTLTQLMKLDSLMAQLPLYIPPPDTPVLRSRIYEPKRSKTGVLEEEFQDRSELVSSNVEKVGPFMLGDLVWAKCRNWPHWPGMIVMDPAKSNTKKEYARVHENPRRYAHFNTMYFVQYFGNDLYKEWTHIGRIHPYEGWDAFQQQVIRQKLVHKIQNKFSECDSFIKSKTVKEKHRSNWIASIAEADEAAKLSRDERIQLLTYHYLKV